MRALNPAVGDAVKPDDAIDPPARDEFDDRALPALWITRNTPAHKSGLISPQSPLARSNLEWITDYLKSGATFPHDRFWLFAMSAYESKMVVHEKAPIG